MNEGMQRWYQASEEIGDSCVDRLHSKNLLKQDYGLVD